jgi:hypothetical protein
MSDIRSYRLSSQPQRSSLRGVSRFPLIACFILPIFTVPRLNVGGTFLLSDFFVLAILPAILMNGRFNLRQPYLKLILFLLGIWFFGAFISDIVNGTSATNFVRGWAKIVFFALNLTTIFILVNGSQKRMSVLLAGLGIGLLLRWAMGVDLYQSGPFFGLAWKFGNSLGCTLLFYLIVEKYIRSGQGIIGIAWSAVDLMLNARSMFLATFLAAAAHMIAFRVSKAQNRLIVGVLLLAMAAVAMPVGTSIYGNMASSGSLGEAQRDKYLRQTEGGVNIFLGGRPEALISLRAISDNPIFGHGSWAESLEYRVQFFAAQESAGLEVRWQALYNSLRIPSHSHLLGAWVEHGIAGAMFWFSILILTVKAFYEGVLGRYQASFVEMFIFTYTFWNILFSPFGLTSRVDMAIFIVVICNYLNRSYVSKIERMHRK